MRLVALGIAVIAGLLTAGCYTRVADLNLAASAPSPRRFEVVGGEVSGRDCTHWLLSIPFGEMNPSLDGAIERAVANIDGANGLMDVSIHRTLFIGLIYNQVCYTIRGKPVRIAPSTDGPP